jgi:hypothetical protein
VIAEPQTGAQIDEGRQLDPERTIGPRLDEPPFRDPELTHAFPNPVRPHRRVRAAAARR